MSQQIMDKSEINGGKNSGVQVTIPNKFQQKLGIKKEDFLGYYEEYGMIVLKKMD